MKLTKQIINSLEIFAAEVMATAFLLYFGCMGLIPSLDYSNQGVNSLHAALVWGFIVTACIIIFGPISGAHMNPAVTLCALIYKRISLLAGLVYFVAEYFGAILGVWLVKVTTPINKYPEKFCCVRVHPSLSLHEAFLSEFMGTSVLIYTVCSTWDPRNALHQDSMPIKFRNCHIKHCHYTGELYVCLCQPSKRICSGFNQWVLGLSMALFDSSFDRVCIYHTVLQVYFSQKTSKIL